jgi:glycosyltransferase involved in cell wall biosynthesis
MIIHLPQSELALNMKNNWDAGPLDLSVILITLNEGHHLRETLNNLKQFAKEVFIIDSFSIDDTVNIALEYGVNISQRKFKGFGDQWNFALQNCKIKTKWTMKLDPDERITQDLKISIGNAIQNNNLIGYFLVRNLCFMGKRLPVKQKILRIWMTGYCKFSDVAVNEYPIVNGKIGNLKGSLDHFDSPNLHHWILKQNNYTTAEAAWQFNRGKLSASPILFGNKLERRMWLKKFFWKLPFRYNLLFIYHYIFLRAFTAGKQGYYWSVLRTFVYRQWEIKFFEMNLTDSVYKIYKDMPGIPDSRIYQHKA